MLAIVAAAFAEEDIYSPFKRTAIIQGRINNIYLKEKKFERKMKSLEDQERKLQQELEDLYNDMKYAASPRDRKNMEIAIEKKQKQVQALRLAKVKIVRRMRRVSDKITAPFRDNLVRSTRTEDRVGLENDQTFVAEKLRTQKTIVKVSTKLAKKYAIIAAQVAAAKALAHAQAKNMGAKTEAYVAAQSKAAYAATYKKIIKTINARVAAGVARKEVSDVAQEAIEPIANKLVQEKTLIPNTAIAEKIAKNVVAGVKGVLKTVTKKAVKKVIAKKTVKTVAKKAVAKKAQKK